MYDNATFIMGDWCVVGNNISAGSTDAIYIYFYYVAYDMYGNSSLFIGDMYIENNTLNSSSYGLDIDYEDYYIGYMEDNSRTT